MKNNLTAVVVSHSFDPEVNVFLFDDYQTACNFIKDEFEREKDIDVNENGWEIDEEKTVFEEDMAILATTYPLSGVQTTTWQITNNVFEKNGS